jgi:hypothetical protein
MFEKVNGVWMPGPKIKTQWPTNMYHRGSYFHGPDAINKLETRLLQLDGNPFALREELGIIAQEMQDGLF